MNDIVIFEKHVLDLMSGPDKDILDIGFGWGVTSNYFYNKGVKSLTIVEIREDLYKRALEWSKDKDNVSVILGDWIDIIPNLNTKYDGIYMDTFCPEGEDFRMDKTEEELKETLDYFYEEPSKEEWNKYKSFEEYCKKIANEDCILSIWEYAKIRDDLNYIMVDTNWGGKEYPSKHKLCWTYFKEGEFKQKQILI